MRTWAPRRGALRLLSFLVPRDRRAEWLEEWEGEVDTLVEARRAGRAGAYPGVAWFVAGALPHALSIRGEGWTMESVALDLRYAWRVLRRAPGFTVVAALTLALGIGANGAMFSLVNGLLFRPPAGVDAPDRLVQIARSYDSAPRWDNWSWPAARFIREQAGVFSDVAGYSGSAFVLGRGEAAESLPGQYVSGSYFPVLGVRPAVGRLLDERDEVSPGGHPVVVLSHGLWTRRFGADPRVVGQSVSVGSQPYEVVGVAPAGFVGVDALGTPPEIWVPAYQRTFSNGVLPFEEWGSSWFYLFGRLRDGVSLETATAAMGPVSAGLRAASDVNQDMRVLLASGIGLAPEERAEGGRMTLLLAGVAAMVLILTCANVANLVLARATGRVGEVGVRQALGAGRGRLVRQLMVESLLLAALAVLAAIPILAATGGFLPALAPWNVAASLEPDARVYVFLAGVGMTAGLLFGVIPSLTVSRSDVARVLREGGGTIGRGRARVRDAMVVGQLALSLGLVSGAALLGRSVLNARGADPGFEPDGMVVGFLNLRASGRYRDAGSVTSFQERLLVAVEGMPGVTHAALAGQAPILGGHSRSSVVPLEQADDPTAGFEAEDTPVSPGYFQAMGIPVLRGRPFRPASDEPEPVVIVNERLAALFWPGEDAVGKVLYASGEPRTVVGVVGDVQMRSLRSPANPGAYYPYHQSPSTYLALHVRGGGPVGRLAPELRRSVAEVDPELPLTGVTDLREGLARSLAETRTFVWVVGAFAGLSLVLSLIGLYGLVSHGVSQRSREMGIRIALGAGPGGLTRMVLIHAAALAGTGAFLGVGVALLLGKALEGVLFGVGAGNPIVLAGTTVLLLATSLTAAWLPARRAGRVDAAVSLREG
jgi:predicted permease